MKRAELSSKYPMSPVLTKPSSSIAFSVAFGSLKYP
jgi:hypothetical protein